MTILFNKLSNTIFYTFDLKTNTLSWYRANDIKDIFPSGILLFFVVTDADNEHIYKSLQPIY
ncbi:hypothetical protein V428_07295 [Aeromonas hydrophila subsp. hydrophila AL09-71]|nr:hypothetical protein AHML_07075 [Aeromonas hydrophila ML09-119]AHX31892.1 hypothetical protein V428_07295 [Aeromonas hydrophila subsp. hydrophila AL09-71]AHX68690.1 hypothetical protein V429_07300 [Aeromonas hydrophila pc104A]KYQ11599.1 hypothetical protein AW872_02610 [Aeromonas hydrophila]KYQ14143.1 hypothetical protein AW873_02615 [Aeromonas hydrophila]